MAEYRNNGKVSTEMDPKEVGLTDAQKQQEIEQDKGGCLAASIIVASVVFGAYIVLSSH